MARVPFLSNLGILDVEQAKNPLISTFPRAFNVSALPIWISTISQMQMGEDTRSNWGTAIKFYIENCINANQFPFSNFKQSANDQILDDLKFARQAIVKFMDRSRLLEMVILRATRREVEMNAIGFTLRVCGRALWKDPTFEKWLLDTPLPAFRLKHKGRYVKHLSQDVTMSVIEEAEQRWNIGYEIVCRHFPDLPGKHIPSEAELENFILDIMWMPVLRSHRPEGYHHRLI